MEAMISHSICTGILLECLVFAREILNHRVITLRPAHICGFFEVFIILLKLKKIGKTTRSFRYDINQIPYDYTVEVKNRFKGLDLIKCLKNYGLRFVTLYRDQDNPHGKEMQKGKMVV